MTDGWYVVNGEVTVAERMTAKGKVHLILADGAHLTAAGIEVDKNSSLTVYAQSGGSGILKSDATNVGKAGIGGGGAITIHGGYIIANGGSKCAGIGGNSNTDGGTITIYDGEIIATGGTGAAGIGGGYNTSGGTITIYDGDITATGGTGTANVDGAGAGIGGGASNASSATAIPSGGTITINGG
ncbi:MAG: hypothetical protein J6B99_00850, partial [Oscillospiraceae bacterium]|nr:hypothetical protein [Oscillospiraceae bacterium]